MRTSAALAFTMVSALFMPVASAVPAGAASREICPAFTATVTSKPPIPVFDSKKKVAPTVTLAGRLTHCTGPERGAGSLALRVKIAMAVNCSSTQPKTANATETINWTDGKTSTLAVTIPVFADSESFDGTVVSGALKGLDQAATLTGSAPRGTCVTKPLSGGTLTLAKNTKFIFA